MVAVKKMKMSAPRLPAVEAIFILFTAVIRLPNDGQTGALSTRSNSKLMKLADYFHQEPRFRSSGRGA